MLRDGIASHDLRAIVVPDVHSGAGNDALGQLQPLVSEASTMVSERRESLVRFPRHL